MRIWKIIALVALGILLLEVAAVLWFLLSRGISARIPPGALETSVARRLRSFALEGDARNLRNPVEATELSIAEARDHYADHCAICHANNGSGKTAINEGLYPPAPDLREPGTQQLTDGELFSIIKNGVRFTGMPGWGGNDEENWKLVHFIRHLPQLTAREIEFMNEINQLEDAVAEH
jgi:mono/diheme cytochrome c family protein